jgi:hypothetical protein
MAPTNVKGKMACTLQGAAAFRDKQSEFKADCADLFKVHLNKNPDVEWHPRDGPGMNANLRREKARFKLVLDIEFDEETGRPRFPPTNTRLSDELVYLATKHMNSGLRGQRYPYDFDKKGDIDPDRVPSGPAPIIWAHGLPFFPVYKGYYILCGRDHALCIGWLIEEKNKTTMRTNPPWSIGAVVAPKSAVTSEHLVDRQISRHQPWGIERDLRYKGKPMYRDVVSSDHHECAVLPQLDEKADVRPLYSIPGYNARCGPRVPGTCPDLVLKEFFVRHGIDDQIDYVHLCREYSNIYQDDEEELNDQPINATDAFDALDSELTDSDSSLFVSQSPETKDVDVDMDRVETAPVAKPEPDAESDHQPENLAKNQSTAAFMDPDSLEDHGDKLSMHVDDINNPFNIDTIIDDSTIQEIDLEESMTITELLIEKIEAHQSTDLLSPTEEVKTSEDPQVPLPFQNQMELCDPEVEIETEETQAATHTSDELTTSQSTSVPVLCPETDDGSF